MNIIKEIPNNPKWVIRAETKNIILHHAEASICTIKDIDKWHKANSWISVGYHFLVRKDGTVYEGRPLEIEGAHALSYNHDSIGICFEGNFEIETMPLNQQKAGIELINYIQGVYGRKLKIFRHKDVNVTECPGKYFPDSIIFESLKEKEEPKHWAEAHFEYLNKNGIKIHEKRFNEPITRGEMMALLANIYAHFNK